MQNGRKKIKKANGIAKAAGIRVSAGAMKPSRDKRSKDAKNHWSRDWDQ